MGKAGVLIVDDHKIIREGIRSMLTDVESFAVIGEAENGQVALNLIETVTPDIILADINMPGMSGIEFTREVIKIYPAIKIIAVSMHNDEPHIRAMIEAGASGYILKNSGKEELVNALTSVAGGSTYFSEEVKEEIMKSLLQKSPRESTGGTEVILSERELEVLELIAKEFTNNEIAEKLFLSPRTVDAHRRNLLEKTGSRNTAGLVRYAIEHNLLN